MQWKEAKNTTTQTKEKQRGPRGDYSSLENQERQTALLDWEMISVIDKETSLLERLLSLVEAQMGTMDGSVLRWRETTVRRKRGKSDGFLHMKAGSANLLGTRI